MFSVIIKMTRLCVWKKKNSKISLHSDSYMNQDLQNKTKLMRKSVAKIIDQGAWALFLS